MISMTPRNSDRVGRQTTESCYAIDVRDWERRNLFATGTSFEVEWSNNGNVVASIHVQAEPDCLILSYSYQQFEEHWHAVEYPIRLEWTGCHFGGRRAWFLCPGERCNRRVAILYSGKIFACRRCHRLTYTSQRQQAWQRALSRAQRIRTKLGGSRSLFDDFPPKPTHMHWSTYERLRFECEQATSRAWPPHLMRELTRTYF